MQLSIIIPAYNESLNVKQLIHYLIKHAGQSVTEIIVIDGGSSDNTIEMAKNAGATVIMSPLKRRAAQMHYGASIAKGSILYFVHADTFPPASFANDILNAMDKGFAIGRYRTKFDSPKWYLKINAWFTRFDWFVCMGGDQTLFITKELYQTIGGYNTEMMIMEEFEFAKRARETVRYKIFSQATLISARKYDTNSWWRVQMANKKIVSMYRKGASQNDMVEAYKRMLNYR